jgi:hypothetical protein
VRSKVTHVSSILEDSVDVFFVGENACERPAEDLDDREAVEAKTVVTILVIVSIFVRDLFLEKESIL